MPTLNFSFTPAADYTDTYTMVAFGISNPSIPLGQTAVSGYGSTVSGSITLTTADTPYKIKIYTKNCVTPVGVLNLP